MEVILLEKIRKLGNLGDKVKVKPGYARNFLIPEQKAVTATEKNLAEFESRRAGLEAKAKELLAAANARGDALANLVIEIPAIVGDEGKLFGSVGTREIAAAIKNAGVTVEKREVILPNGVIRFAGEFEIQVQLHSDVIKTVKINIVPEH